VPDVVLALDRRHDVLVKRLMDETLQAISLGEAFDLARAMLMDAAREI
jgi:hypothetical protein